MKRGGILTKGVNYGIGLHYEDMLLENGVGAGVR